MQLNLCRSRLSVFNNSKLGLFPTGTEVTLINAVLCRDWAALAQHYDDLVCSQKQAADAAKRDIERQVLAFQQTRQGHHTGSEWDLDRPDRFLLDSPAR